MKKKIWSILLMAVLLIGIMPAQVPAMARENVVSIVSATDGGGNAATATFTSIDFNSVDDYLQFSDMCDYFYNTTEEEMRSIQRYYYCSDQYDICGIPMACGDLNLTGASEGNPVTVTFSIIDGMMSNWPCTEAGFQWYYVLQQFGNGTYKLIHAESTENGKLTARFTDAGTSRILITGYDLARSGLVYDYDDKVANAAAVNSATDKQGNPVTVTTSPLSEDHKAVAITYGYGVVDYNYEKEELKFLAAVDVNLEGSGVSAENPVTVEFAVDGVKEGDTVYAIHYNSTTNEWECLPGTVGNGTVTVTFTSFSPVAFASVVGRQTPITTPTQTPTTPAQASQTSQASNKAETTTTTVNGAVVTQKEMTQSDLNDVQKNILGTYFTAMQNIEQDTMLSAEQKQNKKAETVQAWINSALGVNYRYKNGVYGVYDLKASDLSQTIPILVDGVKAGDQVVIAHLKADGTWEKVVPTEVGNGVVYAKFDSLSPVFVAVLQNSNSMASPKTADANLGIFFVIAAVAALGIAVIVRRRTLAD